MAEEEESLDCPVCFELYDQAARTPKMMPCLHTLCATCLCDLVAKGQGQGQGHGEGQPQIPRGRRIVCPLCREQMVTDKVQTNRYIVAHLRHLERLNTSGGGLSSDSTRPDHAPTRLTSPKHVGVRVLPVGPSIRPLHPNKPQTPSTGSYPPPSAPPPISTPLPRARSHAPSPPRATSQNAAGHQGTADGNPCNDNGNNASQTSGDVVVTLPPRASPFGQPKQPTPKPSSAPDTRPSSVSPTIVPLALRSPLVSPSPRGARLYPTLSRFRMPDPYLEQGHPTSTGQPCPTSPLQPYPTNPGQPHQSNPDLVPRAPSSHPSFSLTTSPEETIFPTAPPASEDWCVTCHETAKASCENHELILGLQVETAPLDAGQQWIIEEQHLYYERLEQEKKDHELAIRLAEASIQDYEDPNPIYSTINPTINSTTSLTPTTNLTTSPNSTINSTTSPNPHSTTTGPTLTINSTTIPSPSSCESGVWRSKAGSSLERLDVSRWTYKQLRDAINSSCDPVLLKVCRKEYDRRWKEAEKKRRQAEKMERKEDKLLRKKERVEEKLARKEQNNARRMKGMRTQE